MCAAAKLLGIETTRRARIANRDHADIALRIFVAKESQSTRVQGLLQRHDARLDLRIQANLFINLLLDVVEFFRANRSKVRKVEAQPFGSIQRAGLLHMVAQNVAQRSVDQVRSGVVPHDARAAVSVGDYRDAVTDPQRFPGFYLMGDESSNGIKRPRHLGQLQQF